MHANIAPQRATVSRRKSGVKSAPTDARATAFSPQIDELGTGRHTMTDLAEDALELGPAFRMARKVAGRFRQEAHEHDGDEQWQRAAEGKEGAPAEHRHDVSGDERGERAAEWDADNGQGDGERPVPAGHVLGCECGRIGHRPAETQASQEAQDAERPEAVDERGGGGQDTEDEDAADEREAAAHAIANETGERPADHHADHAGGDDRPERAARDGPVAHHRRDGDAEQLVVDAVEDDRQRRQQHEQLLPVAPMPVVEDLADVDRVGAGSCHECFIMGSGRES